MTLHEILGFAAGSISMISFIPQVYKTWKIKSAKDVSIQMFILYTTSTFLWIVYGATSNQPAIYMPNTVVLFLSITQVILKINYDLRDKRDQKLKDINGATVPTSITQNKEETHSAKK